MSNKDLLDKILEKKSDEENDFTIEDEKLAPLLKEINLIEDQAIRSFVRSVLLQAGEIFWTSSSSYSELNDNPPDEHQPGGNVLHTRRVVRATELICNAQERTAHEADLLLAAALLHDVTKFGEDNKYDPLHPYTVDSVVKEALIEDSQHANSINRSTTLMLDEDSISLIMRLIRCHLGVWSAIPETFPLTGLDWTLHLADFLATKLHYIIDGKDIVKERWEI